MPCKIRPDECNKKCLSYAVFTKNALTFLWGNATMSKCRGEGAARNLQDVRSDVS